MLCRPCHIGRVVLGSRHIGKGRLALIVVRVHPGHVAQNGDEHPSCHGTIGFKGRAAGAGKNAVLIDILHRLFIPASTEDIGKGMNAPLVVLCPRGHDLYRQQRQKDTHAQQQADPTPSP